MKEKPFQNRIAFRGGTYSLTVTVIVLAILIAVNAFASAMPATLTQYDISSAKLYSVTSNTKALVNALNKDVTVYWIVQADMEDDILENLLGKYESLSDHIEIVKKNPDIYPTFAQQYTSETVQNNSLVVECGERSRFISYSDIYVYETNLSSYSYDVFFDGEGAVTSAIDYVVSEDLPQIYVLEGHGEAELSAAFKEQLEKENIEISTLSLLTADSIPEDADGILIYAPSSDISEEEKGLLAGYVSEGGQLMVMAGPTEEGTLSGLYGILADYGVEKHQSFFALEIQNFTLWDAVAAALVGKAEIVFSRKLHTTGVQHWSQIAFSLILQQIAECFDLVTPSGIFLKAGQKDNQAAAALPPKQFGGFHAVHAVHADIQKNHILCHPSLRIGVKQGFAAGILRNYHFFVGLEAVFQQKLF